MRDYALLVLQSSFDTAVTQTGQIEDRVQSSTDLFEGAAAPITYKALVYLRNAQHQYFDSTYPDTRSSASILTPARHRRALEVYGSAFLRDTVLDHRGERGVLDGSMVPVAEGLTVSDVGLSFAPLNNLLIDGHEDRQADSNAQGGTVAGNGLSVVEDDSGRASLYGSSRRLVLEWSGAEGEGPYRSQLQPPVAIARTELWIRAAELPAAPLPGSPTGFTLGVEDASGNVRWLAAELPRPLGTPAMLTTYRFRGRCFVASDESEFMATAILLKPTHPDRRVGFDDLEVRIPGTPPPPPPPGPVACTHGQRRCCDYLLAEEPRRTRPGIQWCGPDGRWQPCSDCPFGRASCSACRRL